MSYFTHVTHNDLYSFYYNGIRSLSVMQFSRDCHVTIKDATGVNALVFRFSGVMPVGQLDFICEYCASIAYGANGSIRKLVEDHRLLLLMKKLDLVEVMHVSRKCEDPKLETLWSPEDAKAMNA